MHFFVSVDEGQKNVISQQIIKVTEDTHTFSDIYEAITEGIFGEHDVKVYAGKGDGKWNYLREGLHDNISLMLELDLKYIRFNVQTEKNNANQQTQQFERNALNVIMENSRKPYFPSIKIKDTQRDVLYNDVLVLLKENQNEIAKTFIKQLVDVLWYIDPHHDKLAARSLHLPNIFKELNLYQRDGNYNTFYYTGHHKKEQLQREKLERLIKSLELSIGQPWTSEIKWTDFILKVFELTSIIGKYAKYLQKVNNEANVCHINNLAARNPSQDLQVYTIKGVLEINVKYQELSDFLFDKNYYEFFDLEEYVPTDLMQKYRYIKDLQLNFPVIIYRYHQGNYFGTLNYIWKVPLLADQRTETESTRVMAIIQETLPKYFTRQMRKNVLNKVRITKGFTNILFNYIINLLFALQYSLVKKVTPAMLRTLYYDLTGDASTTSNLICKEMEARLRIMLTLEDPSIIVDLRINNGFKGKEFDIFWNEMEAYFNEVRFFFIINIFLYLI